jgi:Rod binding domain-containing protein
MDSAASLYSAPGRGRILPAEDNGASAKPGTGPAKARAAAKDFEAVFLQAMIGEMMSGLGKEGPLGEGEAGGAWRGLLVDQYASSISKAGGIGIADTVYRDILALQEGAQR